MENKHSFQTEAANDGFDQEQAAAGEGTGDSAANNAQAFVSFDDYTMTTDGLSNAVHLR
jgi:hypothetical protein